MRGESNCGPYGDFIQDLDLSVQRICQTLDRIGARRNTLIIVTSDNGGDIPTQPDRPETVAQALGLKINGEQRGDKHTIWQGGVRVPFVVRWPDKLKASATSTAMINLTDVFASIVEIVDGAPPATNDVAPDSRSFVQALRRPETTQQTTRAAMVVTNAQGIFAVRQGPWKYIEGKLPQTWRGSRQSNYQGQAVRQLYHLADDPTEQHNVIETHPHVATTLQRALDAIRDDSDRQH
jgi:arylsulfatase A-like enzyme